MASSEPAGAVPDVAAVLAAAQRIRPWIHRTLVLTSRSIDALVGAPVHFKCENFQRSGSFKARGAFAALTALADADRRRGVITHSSGNHGAALALAGERLGVPVTVVVPESAPAFKRRNIARYGARIVDCGATLADRERTLAEVQAEEGALFVPPYDDPEIIAGQGTAMLELLDQTPELQTVWVPVGGGGLASGAALVGAASGVAVRGGEPELADDAFRSLASGERQPAPPPLTIADGLRTALGELNFRVLRDYRLPITLVSEQAIRDAQRLIWNCLKIVIEPSSAVPLAALLEHGADRPAGVILTGGNVDLP
ncbi:MAG TPA: pyridoxal-phosphate dependent enzyme [Pseudomonadales bacterium]